MPCSLDALGCDSSEIRHRARQRVPNVEVDSVVVRRLATTLTGHEIPGRTPQIFILPHHVDGAITRVSPHGSVESERTFLDGTVVAVRRTFETVSDQRAAGIDSH